jgi:hypothetical protein
MYSPKIREDLIPYLYKLSRHLGQPMTKTANQFIEQAISHFKLTVIFREIEEENQSLKELTDHIKGIISNRKKKTAKVIELLRKIA